MHFALIITRLKWKNVQIFFSRCARCRSVFRLIYFEEKLHHGLFDISLTQSTVHSVDFIEENQIIS